MKRTVPLLLETESGFLHGREQGRQFREKIIAVLETLSADTIQPLDFGNITFLDFSCADELVVKTLKRTVGGDLDGHYLILLHMSPSVIENVNAALELRQMVCVRETDDGERELLGKVSPEIEETYELAIRLGRITARELVAHTGKNITACSNRLTRTKELGLIGWVANEVVETGGRQNVYEPVW